MQDRDDQEAAFATDESLMLLLRRAHQASVDQLARAFEQLDQDLTAPQFAVLAALSQGDNRSQTNLVEATGVDRSTLADLVSRMERKGLVTRTKDARDGRIMLVALTEDGRAIHDAAEERARNADLVQLGLISKSKRKAVIEALKILAGVDNDDSKPKADKKAEKGNKKKKKKKADPEAPVKAKKKK